MLSTSYFGHYIGYIKDFGGNWYRVDDDKVSAVGLNEVRSQGAYMLLYSRICARPSCLLPAAFLKEQQNKKVKIQAVHPSTTQSVLVPSAKCSEVEADCGVESSFVKSAEDAGEDVEMAPCDACLPTVSIESHDSDGFYNSPREGAFPLKLDFYKASTGCDVEDVRQCYRRDTNEGLLRRRYQDSGAATNCTFEKDRRYDTSSFTTGEVEKENSASCTHMHGNAGREGNESVSPDDGPIDAKLNPVFALGFVGSERLENFIKQENGASEVYSSVFPNDDSEDAAAKMSIGLSSDVKLKPLSALGGKRRKELFKQENEISVALGGTTPRIHLNRWFLSENDRSSKYE